MDFKLNQWRNDSEEEDEEHQQQTPNSSNLPKFLLNSHPQQQQQQQHSSSSSSLLPLFSVPESITNLSALDLTSATKFHGMGSYFSSSQWQELELQALIFRHMLAGAAIPHQLVHLVEKSLLASPNYLSHQFYPHYHSPLVQSGYWGKAAMDPEPGRCRRTDGKKWRCSRDVVEGKKYCERHMNRGKNRSRKPVEIPTPYGGNHGGGGGGGGALKTNNSVTAQGVAGGGDTPRFTLSRTSHSMDVLQPNQRHSDFITGTKESFNSKGETSGRTLQRLFDDWPRTFHDTENIANSTNLSISLAGNPPSGFSLTLGTGSENEPITEIADGERVKPRLDWGMSTWETNRVGSMGGPLAEALRSSMSNSSPTSVLHRLARANAGSEASYGST